MAKKLDVIGTVEKAFGMFADDAVNYILLYVPALVVFLAFILGTGMWVLYAVPFMGTVPAFGMFEWGAFAVYIVVMLLVGIATAAALVVKADAHRKGKKLGFVESFSKGLQKFWKVLATALLLTAIVTLGFIAFIIPGIYLMVRLMYAIPATVLEKNYGIKRSWSMSRGKFWATLALIVLLGIISVIVSLIPIIGIAIVLLVMNPITMIAYVLAYHQLK